MKHDNNKINRSGSVLVLSVIMVMVLSLVGIGLIRLGRSARVQSVKDVLNISARSAADAGIEHAVRYMINSWNSASSKYVWLDSWRDLTVWTDPAIPTTPIAHSISRINLGGTYGDASFTYNIYKGTLPNGYQVVSTGTAAGVTRTVHAAVVLRSSFFGVGVKQDALFRVNADMRTIPADADFIIQTNSVEAGSIELKNGVSVPGDVVCGPGGDTDIAVVEKNNVVIDGDTRASDDYIEFPPVFPPVPALPAGSWTVDPNDPTVAYINSSMELSGLLIGAPEIVTTLYIEGNVVIYVDGDTRLKADAVIIVKDGSTLTLYLGGTMITDSGTGLIYEATDGIANPSNALIEDAAHAIDIMGTPACTSIDIKNSGDFYGNIYAPDADLDIFNSGAFYGAFVGENVEMDNSSGYVFVSSLFDFDNLEVLYMGVKDGSWWE